MFVKLIRLLKKYLGRIAKKIISLIPKAIKVKLIRDLIKVDRSSREKIIVKVAESIDEYEQVMELLRRNYIDQGFIKKEDPLKISDYQAAASTAILVAKHGSRVVGTLTLVKRNQIKLPLERAFNLSSEIIDQDVVAEITGLTVDHDYRRKNGFNCLFPLMKFMYFYSKDYMKLNKIFIACFPRDIDFYEAILFFKEISQNSYVEDYLGAPATCLCLNMQGLEEIFQKAYSNKSDAKNLFNYFVKERDEGLLYPESVPVDEKFSHFSNEHYQYFKNKNYQLNFKR